MGNRINGYSTKTQLPFASDWSDAELCLLYNTYVNKTNDFLHKHNRKPFHKKDSPLELDGTKKISLKPFYKYVPYPLDLYVKILFFTENSKELTFYEFVDTITNWIYPKVLNLESYIISQFVRLLKASQSASDTNLSTREEIFVLQHYLNFSEILYREGFSFQSFVAENSSQFANTRSHSTKTSTEKNQDPKHLLVQLCQINKNDTSALDLELTESNKFAFWKKQDSIEAKPCVIPSLDWYTSVVTSYKVYRINNAEKSTATALVEWTTSFFAFLPLTLSTGLKQVLFQKSLSQDEANQHKRKFFQSESKCLTEEFYFIVNNITLIFEKLPWCCLYATWRHGRSINRFTQHLLHYSSACVIVIKTTDDKILGACVNSSWEDVHGHYTGTLDTFLWIYKPQFSVYRATGQTSNFVYLNEKNKYNPKGLGFGGQVNCFRLWVDENFESGYYCLSDATFTSDDSVNKSIKKEPFQVPFRVVNLEVWAENKKESLEDQNKLLQRDEKFLSDRRKIDTRRMFQNNFDKKYLLGKD